MPASGFLDTKIDFSRHSLTHQIFVAYHQEADVYFSPSSSYLRIKEYADSEDGAVRGIYNVDTEDVCYAPCLQQTRDGIFWVAYLKGVKNNSNDSIILKNSFDNCRTWNLVSTIASGYNTFSFCWSLPEFGYNYAVVTMFLNSKWYITIGTLDENGVMSWTVPRDMGIVGATQSFSQIYQRSTDGVWEFFCDIGANHTVFKCENLGIDGTGVWVQSSVISSLYNFYNISWNNDTYVVKYMLAFASNGFQTFISIGTIDIDSNVIWTPTNFSFVGVMHKSKGPRQRDDGVWESLHRRVTPIPANVNSNMGFVFFRCENLALDGTGTWTEFAW